MAHDPTAEDEAMASPSDNLDRLKAAYQTWHDTKGGSVGNWLDLMTDDVRCYSLAAGAPAAEFTAPISSKRDFERYFQGLLADWEMIYYKTEQFLVDGDSIAVRGSTAWRNRKTGRVVETPKADFVTFRDGKVVELHEFYDTAAMMAAAKG
jgi:hypothetical protein